MELEVLCTKRCCSFFKILAIFQVYAVDVISVCHWHG